MIKVKSNELIINLKFILISNFVNPLKSLRFSQEHYTAQKPLISSILKPRTANAIQRAVLSDSVVPNLTKMV